MSPADRKQALALLSMMMRQLSPHLERAKVPTHAYTMPEGDPPDASLEKACRFALEVVESTEFLTVLQRRDLVPESTWKNYDLYGFTGLQEQKLYATALRDLKRIWNTSRPTFFGKDYRPKDAEASGVVGSGEPEVGPDA